MRLQLSLAALALLVAVGSGQVASPTMVIEETPSLSPSTVPQPGGAGNDPQGGGAGEIVLLIPEWAIALSAVGGVFLCFCVIATCGMCIGCVTRSR